ncbi:unnamed protein product, partial [Mesorhabditis spiculigera]
MLRSVRPVGLLRAVHTKSKADPVDLKFSPLTADDYDVAFNACNYDYAGAEPMARALGLGPDKTAGYVDYVVRAAIADGYSFKATDLKSGKHVGFALCSVEPTTKKIDQAALHDAFLPLFNIYSKCNAIFDEWNAAEGKWNKWLSYNIAWIAPDYRGNHSLSRHISTTGLDVAKLKQEGIGGMKGVSVTKAVLKVAKRNGWQAVGTVPRAEYIVHRVPLPNDGFMATTIVKPLE